MDFHIRKPSALGPTPTGWTPLDPTYGERKCLMLRFPGLNPTKEFQAPQHTLSPIHKSKFKEAIKHEQYHFLGYNTM
jgi:hypothetical protein